MSLFQNPDRLTDLDKPAKALVMSLATWGDAILGLTVEGIVRKPLHVQVKVVDGIEGGDMEAHPFAIKLGEKSCGKTRDTPSRFRWDVVIIQYFVADFRHGFDCVWGGMNGWTLMAE